MSDLVPDQLRQSIQNHLDLNCMGSTTERTAIRAATSAVPSAGKTPDQFSDDVWQQFMEKKNTHWVGNNAMWGKISEGICEYLNNMWGGSVGGGSLDWKDSCRVVSTSNIALSGLQTIDGVLVKADERVLVAGQTDKKYNGIYSAKAAAWVRSDDGQTFSGGMTVYVEEGDEHSKTYWVDVTPGLVEIGVTEIDIVKWNAVDYISAVDWKDSCRTASGSNETLSGLREVGGVTVVAGNRVLLFGQTDAKQNGLWLAYTGNWVRAYDADRSPEVTCGLTVYVEEGTNQKKYYTLTTYNPITLGTTGLVFENLVGGGGTTVNYNQEDFSYTDSKVFALAQSPVSKSETVYVNGVRIRPTTDYSVSGSQLTIAEGYYMESGFSVGIHYAY